jgi:16S rRNA (guanine966-N2)-methyltransferase
VLVESDRRAAATVAANIRSLGLDGVRLLSTTVAAALSGEPPDGAAADLVLVDPPYDVPEEALGEVLGRLAAGWLATGGLVVVERSSRSPEPRWPAGIEPVGTARRYGETTLWWATRP